MNQNGTRENVGHATKHSSLDTVRDFKVYSYNYRFQFTKFQKVIQDFNQTDTTHTLKSISHTHIT